MNKVFLSSEIELPALFSMFKFSLNDDTLRVEGAVPLLKKHADSLRRAKPKIIARLQGHGGVEKTSEVVNHTSGVPDTSTVEQPYLESERAVLFEMTEPDVPSRVGVILFSLGRLHDTAVGIGDTEVFAALDGIYDRLNTFNESVIPDTEIARAERLIESWAAVAVGRCHGSGCGGI